MVIEAGARVGPLAVVGRDSRIGAGAQVVESVLQEEVAVGPGAVVERSVLVRRAVVGGASHLSNAVVGEACRVGADNVLANGLCLYPDVVLPDASVKFRELEGRDTSQGASVGRSTT